MSKKSANPKTPANAPEPAQEAPAPVAAPTAPDNPQSTLVSPSAAFLAVYYEADGSPAVVGAGFSKAEAKHAAEKARRRYEKASGRDVERFKVFSIQLGS